MPWACNPMTNGWRILVTIVMLAASKQPSILMADGGRNMFAVQQLDLPPANPDKEASTAISARWLPGLLGSKPAVRPFFGAVYTPTAGAVNHVVIAMVDAPGQHRNFTDSPKDLGKTSDPTWCTLSALAGSPLFTCAASTVYRALTRKGAMQIANHPTGDQLTRQQVQAADVAFTSTYVFG